MLRFEEAAVNCWYVLRGYLTAGNVGYKSPAKRPGGKGRGEIDLLALKIDEKGKPENCMRVEVGVGIKSHFPFTDKKKGSSADDMRRLLKKLLSRGADLKAREYFGTNEYRNQFITSEFGGNACGKVKRRIEELKMTREFNVEVVEVEGDESKISLKVKNDPKDGEIELSGVMGAEILPFSRVRHQLADLFKLNNLADKDFPDPTMRAIQYMVRIRDLEARKVGGR